MRDIRIEALCPVSGQGKPVNEWDTCTTRCAWINPETNECTHGTNDIIEKLEYIELALYDLQGEDGGQRG